MKITKKNDFLKKKKKTLYDKDMAEIVRDKRDKFFRI
jgi:hypothetical protein